MSACRSVIASCSTATIRIAKATGFRSNSARRSSRATGQGQGLAQVRQSQIGLIGGCGWIHRGRRSKTTERFGGVMPLTVPAFLTWVKG